MAPEQLQGGLTDGGPTCSRPARFSTRCWRATRHSTRARWRRPWRRFSTPIRRCSEDRPRSRPPIASSTAPSPKSPAQRYPSAAAMADDLRTVLDARDDEPRRARAVTRFVVLPFRLLRADPEIDFLAFGLADAIANVALVRWSRSSCVPRWLQHALPRVSRSDGHRERAQRRCRADRHAGARGRAAPSSVQLVEAPAGSLIWSDTSQVPVGDLFRLQDDLSRRIVESLALPLSGRERRALGHDVPFSAKAYEFYLRANQLGHDPASLDIARGLYEQAVQADPQYAPAWARLGHLYRVVGKFRERTGDCRPRGGRAQSCARTQSGPFHGRPCLCADRSRLRSGARCDGAAHSTRLIAQQRPGAVCRTRAPVPVLWSACRPLLPRTNAPGVWIPNVRTSVQYTLFMAGDYLRAAAEPGGYAAIGGIALVIAGHPDAIRQCRKECEMLRARQA